MKNKLFACSMLTMLLVSTFTLALNIQPVKASGTIVIEADGSVNPPSANITSSDNITYTFTDNNYDNIVVERSNIIVDGNGKTLQRSGSGAGFELVGISNVTIKNTNIKSFTWGVRLSASSNNTVSGNTITNNTWAGVYLDSSSFNIVSGNTITNNGDGVYLDSSSFNIVSSNTITNNSYGVFLGSSSDYNTVSGNTITNTNHGVWLDLSSDYNTVSGNTITNNTDYGVILVSSSFNIVSGNTITNSTTGVELFSSSYNTVSSNTITDSTDSGVNLNYHCNNSTVSGNAITNNTQGVVLHAVTADKISDNTITDNTIANSTLYGVRLYQSSNNTFYHNNFIENTQQVYIDSPGYANSWNSSYPSGGNYWSNYTGDDEKRGPDQDEAGSDGIGDTSHVLDAENQDNYPYMNENGWVRVRNINTTLGYWAIQEAIDAFETLDSHTIRVDAGTYVENVDVYKQLNITGAGTDVTTVKAADPNNHVFNVTANNVTISGFTVKDATGSFRAGVYLYYSDYSRIENINATNNRNGVYLAFSYNNTVSGNTITDSTDYGVYLYSSSFNIVSGNTITNNGDGVYLPSTSNNNTVSGNTITNNTDYGVILVSSSFNIVSSNTITNNGDGVYLYSSYYNIVSSNTITNNRYGVYLYSSSKFNTVSGNTITNNTGGVDVYASSFNTFSGNTITNNSQSVHLFGSFSNNVSGNTITNSTTGVALDSSSNNNTVSGNTITNNTNSGVYLYSSSYNTVSGNTITNSSSGVWLDLSSDYNTVSGNTITNNTQGVALWRASNNTFYHNNFIDNKQQVIIATDGYANSWNSSYPTGGNYWSNYAGVDLYSGPNQDEDGRDGIGDAPHVLDDWNQDNYPLMKPYGGPYDIGITNIATSKTVIGQGCNLTIIVKILNYGINTETFNVTVYYGKYLTITLEQWDTFWSMGDVNEDGYINQTDVELIAAHLGTSDPQYDIDESGFVDVNDLAICGLNYGLDIWTYFSIGGLIGKQTVYDLPARSQSTLTFIWNTAGVPYNNWTITANATILPIETDTADNTRTCWVVVTIHGDVDGDYIVDGSDLSHLNEAYGSTRESPNWNPNCDLDDNNKVDALDLFELSKNYGKTNPEVLFSTLAASASMIVALVAYVALKTLRKKRAKIKMFRRL